MDVLILGIGNADRGDDAAGIEVARRVGGAVGPDITVRIHGGDGAGLIEAWDGFERVVLVDAVRSGAAPGSILRLEASAGPLPSRLGGASTHLLGVAEAVELARVVGRLPRHLTLIAIEAHEFAYGAPLSPQVEAAVETVANELRALAPAP